MGIMANKYQGIYTNCMIVWECWCPPQASRKMISGTGILAANFKAMVFNP